MVKNAGGNKAKGFARKSFGRSSNSLRLSEDDADTSEHTDPRLTERMMDDISDMWQNIQLRICKKVLQFFSKK